MRGFPRLYASLLLGRIAGQMLSVALVLFVLGRYHSPQLAGAAVFLITFPGLLASPIAGALLDRYGRTKLITVDFLLAALGLFLIALLSAEQSLPASLLLTICALTSLTGPLSAAGARATVPTIVPMHLWERANALDGSSHALSSIIGAPVAGALVALAGGEWALAATALLFGCAGIAILGVGDRAARPLGRSVFHDAWEGLVYVVRNRTLVGLALTFLGYSIGWGSLVIAIPVLVLERLHQGPATVGYLWGAVAAAGLVATLIVGRVRMQGRERPLIAASIVAVAAAMVLLPFATSIAAVAIAMVAIAVASTPFDVAFPTLRQRRTDPASFGRAFAVSVSLNMLGGPVGSAIAGPLIAWSLNGALWIAVAFTAAAAIFPMLVIPARDER